MKQQTYEKTLKVLLKHRRNPGMLQRFLNLTAIILYTQGDKAESAYREIMNEDLNK